MFMSIKGVCHSLSQSTAWC